MSNYFSLVLIAVVAANLIASTEAKDCGNVFPAARAFANGIDLSKFSLHKIDTGSLGNPVFKFTCDKNQSQSIDNTNNGSDNTTLRSAASESYDVPDCINVPIQEIAGGDIRGINIYAMDFASKRESMEADYDVGGFLGMFSDSGSMDATYSQYFGAARQMGLVTASVTGFVPSVHPSWSPSRPQWTDDVQYYIDGKLSAFPIWNETAVPVYEYWFKTWGTHYVNQACLGAAMFSGYYTTTDFAAATTQTFLQQQGSIGSLLFAKAAGGFSGDVGTLDAGFAKASVWEQYWIGGSGAPVSNTSDSFNTWAKSGLLHPHYIGCPNGEPLHLSSFSSLLPGATLARAVMQNRLFKSINSITGPIVLPVVAVATGTVAATFDIAAQNYYDKIFVTKEVLARIDVVATKVASVVAKGNINCPRPWDDNACRTFFGFQCSCVGCNTIKQDVQFALTNQTAVLNRFAKVKAAAVDLTKSSMVDHLQVVALSMDYYTLLAVAGSTNVKKSCRWQLFVNGNLAQEIEVASITYPVKMIS